MALTDNLVSYWKFDESSGNAADSLSNNTLTNHNACTYDAGKINNGVVTAAASLQYLDTPDDVDYDGKANFSVAFWLKPSTTNDDTMPITKWGTDTANNQSWRTIFASNKLLFVIGNGTTAGTITPTSTLSGSTMYHIVYTYDNSQASGSRGKVYINGSDNTASDDTPSTMLAGTAGLIVGNRTGLPAGGYYNGRMDELGIWTRTLSSTEVSALYNGGNGTSYPFYLLDASVGSFILTGINSILSKGIAIGLAVGEFVLTGVSAIFDRGWGIAASTRNFILTGYDVLLDITGWTDRTKPSTSWTNRTKPSTSFTDRTKPTTTWTKVDRF